MSTVRAALLLLSLAPGWAAEVATIPATAPGDTLADPADLVPWPDAAYPRFAPGSAANATWLLDAPAGHRGRAVAGPDGRLRFADGSPARFWGTTTVYGMTFPEKREEIALMADGIAAAGYNAVRFHHNDLASKGLGFLKRDPASNAALDPEMLDRLDQLAAELFKRGIYLYVDLIDSRPTLEEDGVPGWEDMKKESGWKGLFPHPAIVAAWKRTTTALLDHTNPYTGRRWADEPGVMAVECINENGLFWDWNWKLSPKMSAWFDQTWNAWLAKRYGSRDALAKAWTDAEGACGLFADEDPATSSVFRPPLAPLPDWDRPFRSKTRGAARANDHTAFLAELSTGFYREASAHLRSLGYGGMVIGSHELQGPANQAAEVAGAGSIAAHLYANPRLAWGARPGSSGVVMEGVDVKSRNWFANIPRIKVAGVPGINGEWTGGSLVYRADVNFGVAAATAFHQVDASLHFSYAHRWVGQPMHAHDTFVDWIQWKKEWGVTFTSVHDVPWMAANRAAAAMFIRGDFTAPQVSVDIALSAEDVREQNLHALGINGGGGTVGGGATFLPLLHRVQTRFFDSRYDGDADIAYLTGRSASGDYSKARHAVLVGDNPWTDSRHQRRDLGAPARSVHPAARIVTIDTPVTFTVTAPWTTPHTLAFPRYEGAIEKASLPSGAMPIGESGDGKHVLGWLDDRFLVLPNGRAFGEAIGDARWLLRLHLAACARWKLPTGGTSADGTGYRSDNGELAVDWSTGVLTVDTARTQGFSGFVGWRGANDTRDLSCTVRAPYAVVTATSIDGKPLRETRRALLVACGRMQNTGQQVADGKPVKTGTAPKLVEALRGRLSLRVPTDLAVYALDHEGKRLGLVETTTTGDRLAFELSPRWQTIWFELAPKEAVTAASGWPAAGMASTLEAERPKLIPLADFVAAVNRPQAADVQDAGTGGGTAALADLSTVKPFQVYANAAARKVADGIQVTYGKVTKDWSGGVWFPASGSGGTGIVVRMKGDGTRPREFYVSFRANGTSFRSRNLNDQFENDQWHEVTLGAADFTAEGKDKVPVAFDRIDQVHVGCVGPLMENQSVAVFASISMITPAVADISLPAVTVPSAPALAIPLLADAGITPDGTPSEPAWQKAIGFAIDEDKVPAWHFTGTHLATGSRARGEKATCRLFGTRAGLALLVDIDKGGDGPRPSTGDWYRGDCVELFSDVGLAGEKPTRQLFLAWSRPNSDQAQGSDPSITAGRARTARGYRLESLIPWTALGFTGQPDAAFGLDLQIDLGLATGGLLQLNYATGTNEAWMSTKRYLKATLVKTP